MALGKRAYASPQPTQEGKTALLGAELEMVESARSSYVSPKIAWGRHHVVGWRNLNLDFGTVRVVGACLNERQGTVRFTPCMHLCLRTAMWLL